MQTIAVASSQKWAAERAVERVAGVRAVAQELDVKIPSANQKSDTALAHQVLNALAWDVEVPHENIEVRVENGWVTLTGEASWQFSATRRNALCVI